jgi:methylphosphotriester-DNA--protein-cysteine methyltransferase
MDSATHFPDTDIPALDHDSCYRALAAKDTRFDMHFLYHCRGG